MPKANRSLSLLALAALLAGCANFAAISSGMPAQQVLAKFGAPGTVWKNPDGSEVWEYPQGPVGVQTFMVTLEPDHLVREVHQVLSEEYLAKVQAGLTRDQVRRLLGAPGRVEYFPRRDEEVWTWRIQEFHFRYRRFHALFDRSTGILRSTLTIDEDPPDDGKGRS